MDPELRDGFRLGSFLVYPLRNEFVGDEGPVHVPPRVMDVLLRLAADPGEVVPRQTLLDDVWDGVTVSDETLSRAVSELRSALGERRGHHAYVQTVPKRGYRLVAPVTALEAVAGPAPTTGATPEIQGFVAPQPHARGGPAVLSPQGPAVAPPAAQEAAPAAPPPAADPGADHPLSLWQELKRRNVFRVGAAYAAAAWLIIEVVSTVFPYVGLDDGAVRLVVTALAIGMPISLALAWAFEITPEGILYDTPELARRESVRARKLRRLDAVTILTITVAIGVFVYRSLTFDGGEQPVAGAPPPATPPSSAATPIAARSIAVLPFADLTDSSDKGYLADGLAEELIALLARSSGLRVVPRTASFYYKDKDVEMATIAERLQVNHILDGSVRVSDNRVRVRAALSDARTSTLQWSESFEVELSGIFDVQDTIASAVSDALAIQLDLGKGETTFAAPTANVGAYEFYLRGLDYLHRPRQLESLASAQALFQRALDLDPQYARAYASLCETLLGMYILTSDVDEFEAAERACHRALTLDRELEDVYVALGQMYRHSGQYEKALREHRAAVARHPERGVAHLELGMTLAAAGELEEAERELRQGIELEPGYWGGYTSLGYFLYKQGRYAEAAANYQVAVELTPDNPAGFNNLAAAYYMLEDFEQAAAAYQESLALEPTRSAYTNTGLMYFYSGRFAEAVEMQQRAVELAPEDHRVWGRLGDAARFASGQEDQSQPAYQRAAELARERLRINPRDWDTMGLLAIYLAHLGEHDKATVLTERGFELDPEPGLMHYYAALVAVEGGDIPAAYRHLEQSIAAGFSTTLIRSEPDIAPLVQNPEFRALLESPGQGEDPS